MNANTDSQYCSANLYGEDYRLLSEDRKFWGQVAANEWEANTFVVLDRFLKTDSVYFDVGAWIGPTVLFAARRCEKVYCIEPDLFAYERLLANLRMNDVDNVVLFNGALHYKNGAVQIADESGFGESTTRVQATPSKGSVEVIGVKISDLFEWWNIKQIDLVKMDIEGAEFDLVPSLLEVFPRIKPVFHLSLHAPLFAESERQEKLTTILALVDHYAFCYDKHLNKIHPKEILNEPFTHHFNAITLTDTAL